jgi:mannan endo-1,4-beta-mannosidase
MKLKLMNMKKNLSFLITLILIFFSTGTFAATVSKNKAIKPVNRKASVQARNLLKYIYNDLSGVKVLSGHHEYNFDSMNYIEVVHDITGKYPAIYGCDFGMSTGESPQRADEIRRNIVKKAIKWWNAGGIVTLCWHESKPGSEVQSFPSTQKKMSQEDFNQLITPGTPGYKLLIAEIDQIASYLEMLRDANVPILWRPYHETNGGWFWWGKKQNFASLWNILYDRLTNYHKLNNLIWVYSPNCQINPNIGPYSDYYPGHSQVDILAFDGYVNASSGFLEAWQSDLITLGEGRPVAMGECGMLPTPEQLSGMYNKLSWFMTWRDMLTKKNTNEQIQKLYNDPRVITRDEVPDLKH